MSSVSACDNCVGIIIVVTSIVTLRTLKAKMRDMSAKTRYMQSQLNRLMFAEVRRHPGTGWVPPCEADGSHPGA